MSKPEVLNSDQLRNLTLTEIEKMKDREKKETNQNELIIKRMESD